MRARIRLVDLGAVVEVWDASTVAPTVSPDALDTESEDGRGLFLVGQLGEKWGYYYPAVGGKVVWAQIATPPPNGIRPAQARDRRSGYERWGFDELPRVRT